MKIILTLALMISSPSAFAIVNSSNCPDKFSVTFENIKRVEWNQQIEADQYLKASWENLKDSEKLVQEFYISTKSDTALCIYINGKTAAFLQTNDGRDELVIPYNNSNMLYFKMKVLSFSKNSIEISQDLESKNLLAPIFKFDPETGLNPIGQAKMGTAQAINIQVLK